MLFSCSSNCLILIFFMLYLSHLIRITYIYNFLFMLLMLNNNKSQGFPETEWTQRRLYVRGPRRVFYEEQRGSPIRLLSYREVEMLYGIDPIDIQNPQDNKFHFIADRMERNGKSNISPGNLYM